MHAEVSGLGFRFKGFWVRQAEAKGLNFGLVRVEPLGSESLDKPRVDGVGGLRFGVEGFRVWGLGFKV